MATHAETWLDAGTAAPAYFEIVEFVPKKDGLLLPRPALKWLPWLDEPNTTELVIELAELGRLIGHSNAFFETGLAPLISELRTELLTGDKTLGRTGLIALGERFSRGKLSANRSLYLNNRIQHHLDIVMGQTSRLVFLAVAETFELWTLPFYISIRPRLLPLIQEHSSLLALAEANPDRE